MLRIAAAKEVTALPGGRIPGCDFRRSEIVSYRGAPAMFVGLVPASHGEPFGKLRYVAGADNGFVFARISLIKRWPSPANGRGDLA